MIPIAFFYVMWQERMHVIWIKVNFYKHVIIHKKIILNIQRNLTESIKIKINIYKQQSCVTIN